VSTTSSTPVQLGLPSAKVSSAGVDAKRLERALRRAVAGEVRFDAGSRGAYSTDASNYRQLPIGVVVPRDADDVEAAVAVCREHGAPVLNRGGGTSVAGQGCNVAVLLDHTKYLHHILELDPRRRIARVEPGIYRDRLDDAAREHGLTFGPDPATHDHCAIGGMIGNNACGAHAQMAGRTSENIDGLEILTYDGLRMRVGPTSGEELERTIAAGGRQGQIYQDLQTLRDRYAELIRERFPKIPRRVSGYCLEQLLPENGFNLARALVGSESTCVTILEATCRLMPAPKVKVLVLLGYPDVYQAADHVPDVLPFEPIALEGLDDILIDNLRRKGLHASDLGMLPEGRGWLMVELGAPTREQGHARAEELIRKLGKGRKHGVVGAKLVDDPAQEQLIWEIRESGLGATALVPGEPLTWEGWEDSAVPPDKLGGYLRDLRGLYEKYGYNGAFYGHFGQGCLHTRVNFDLETAPGIAAWRQFLDEAADLVVRYGGSFSGEHGDGQSRAELLPKLYGPELIDAFRQFKAIWDPGNKMNPGKVVNPYPITSNLRLGAGYNPKRLPTKFAYPDDQFDFSRAALRCVGIGKCRREQGGVMCPSYMVTREEEHSTRGRARLLFEMLNGEETPGGWRSKAVKDALDLCLACKGCKKDCPVNVDMATYKAEFMHHHYKGRLRPRQAYSIGLIYWAARLASKLPMAANLATQTPLVRDLVKRAGGIAPGRSVPRFADEPFTAWFNRRPSVQAGEDRPRVLLWPDTFNNYFHPGTARATVEVLEAAGFEVLLPPRPLCCGRPLYDYGMLDLARHLLRQVLDQLRPLIREGVPMVGIEPSCLAVFRDELAQMLPGDEDARRLAEQSFTLAEFLNEHAPAFQPPRLEARALVQHHCHHDAVMGFKQDQQLFERLGLDAEVLDSGCCGMAGSFGFEPGDHYKVAMLEGERVLLPRVRSAPPDTLVLADGFSCRTQIEQGTNRRALHLAEVIRLAMRAEEGPAPAMAVPAELANDVLDTSMNGHHPGRAKVITVAGAAASAAAIAAYGVRRRLRS
jgi:FAD/FMN-containing dehydrogenase/Fe-S oxidoreductase